MLCTGMWAQTVTLTFTGRDAANNWVQLDRVSITNLTKGWQEIIYWPDTILTMQNSTEIIDYANNGGFALSQNNPNPFNGTTDVLLMVSDAGMVTLEITDANGRNVGMHRVRLQSGTHQLRVTLSAAGTYVMTARQNGKSSSIKMVNNGGGSKNAIEKIGIYERTNVMKSGEATKGNVVHPWAYGDDLTIIGYATICGTECTMQFSRQLLYDETTTIYFSESITTPTVAASSVSNITISSASVSSSVSGECGVTSRGFCYGTSSNPTISGQHTTNGSGTGSFTGTINGLTAGTTYYVRAYATNAVGTAYGSQTNFTALALPTVTTNIISNITNNTATGGGNVTSQGTDSVTSRGVCWGISHNPTISNSHTTDGSGIGSFTSNITGLTQGITYYVRAYATNSVGTSYGNEVIFTTSALQLPTVITSEVINIAATTATCSGEVTSDGGATVTERGICLSTTTVSPTINDTHINAGSGTGSFSANISNLSPQTIYFMRAYATNSMGTAYGDHVSFIIPSGQPCPGTATLTDRDGNTYNTIWIGEQCWMRENLRTTHYADNMEIPDGIHYDSTSTSFTSPFRYAPNYDESNVATYGYLYNWAAVMHGASSSGTNPSGVQGICPDGWHVPSDAEWTQFTDYVSSQYFCLNDNTYIAKALASSTGWIDWGGGNCSVGTSPASNNATGFSALPAGSRGYSTFSRSAFFWSTTECNSSQAYCRYLDSFDPLVFRHYYGKYDWLSVRCVRDEGDMPTVTTSFVTDITSSTATSGGNVTSDGGATVTSRGVCWSISHNPTVSDSHTTNGTGMGSFTSSLTGLSSGTTYSVRAYATNSVGTAYGSEESFTTEIEMPQDGQPCPNAATLTDIDGNTYNTVQIGNQCWMKENLRTTHYADNTAIPVGSTYSNTEPYRYAPNNNESNVATYGYLYNWAAVMHGASSSSANPSGVQGVCPTGWHVPSNAEWTELTDYVSSQSQYVCGSDNTYVAKALSGNIGWNSNYDGECVVGNSITSSYSNATGFSALPAGYYRGNPYGLCSYAYFWSATECGSSTAYCRSLYYKNANVSRVGTNDHCGFSVRCLRDTTETETSQDGHPCPNATTLTDIDGNTYNTVQIGSQCWMKENLRTTHYTDNTPIPVGGTFSYTDPVLCAPNGDENNVATYGYLYNWAAVMHGTGSSSANPSGVQGVCPTGWHVPSDAEWTQLTDYVSSQSQYVCGSDNTYIAKALASATGWNSNITTCAVGNTPSSNNATGFSALPAGYRSIYSGDVGYYDNVGNSAHFWSTTENEINNSNAHNRYFNYYGVTVTRNVSGKCVGQSVRCLRD